MVFNPEDHTYSLGDKQIRGITGTLVHRAYPDTYKEVDHSVLANAASNGTQMHEAIQAYEEAVRNGDFFLPAMDTPELKNYLQLKDQYDIVPIANEYLVSDEEHYASSIDMLAWVKGELSIIDFKRTYTLHKNNVALQDSIYKRFFEAQNKGLEVKGLYVMHLRNEVAEFVSLEKVDDDFIDSLIADDIAGKPIASVVPETIKSSEDDYIEISRRIEELEEKRDNLKDKILEEMKSNYQKSVDTGKVLYTIKDESTRSSFDDKRFKEEHEDLYKQYIVKTKTKSSFTIKIRKDGNNR